MNIITTREKEIDFHEGVFFQIIELSKKPRAVISVKIKFGSEKQRLYGIVSYWNNGRWEVIYEEDCHGMEIMTELLKAEKVYANMEDEERLEIYKKDRNNLIRIGAAVLGYNADVVLSELEAKESSDKPTDEKLEQLKEALAAYAHNTWTKHLLKYVINSAFSSDGREVFGEYQSHWWVSRGLIERWQRKMQTTYDELPESEKEARKEEAEEIINIVKHFYKEQGDD
jgi:hypothetical protein